MEFESKTVVITGASSGMGLLASQCFAREGANVVMLAQTPEKLAQKVAEVNSIGVGKAIGIPVDVRCYDQIAEACRKAYETFGSIDITMGCAGGSEYRIKQVPAGTDFFDVPIEVYDWGLDVNLKGQFYLAHAAMKYMAINRSGVVVNIGSVTGAEGCMGDASVAYATAKSGVMIGLTKSLATQGAPYGIRCFCVSPGPVLTRANMANMKTLLGRAAEPQEIVDFIMYLASEKGAFVTGTNYLIDGGRIIYGKKLS